MALTRNKLSIIRRAYFVLVLIEGACMKIGTVYINRLPWRVNRITRYQQGFGYGTGLGFVLVEGDEDKLDLPGCFFSSFICCR